MPNRTESISIQDLQVKILTILHLRSKEDRGAGIYILQRTVNKYKASGKSYKFDTVFQAVKNLESSGFIEYDKHDFWQLTEKGENQISIFQNKIGHKYQSLKIKLNRTLN